MRDYGCLIALVHPAGGDDKSAKHCQTVVVLLEQTGAAEERNGEVIA